MEVNAAESAQETKKSKPRSDKLEIVKILVLALVSFVAGFALVLVFLRAPTDDDDNASIAEDKKELAAVPAPAAAPSSGNETVPQALPGEPAPAVVPPPSGGGYEPAPAVAPPPSGGGYEPAPSAAPPVQEGGYEPAAATGASGSEPASALPTGSTATADQGAAAAEVPPGKTPDGVILDGEAFYLKCWDASGMERKGAECDRLATFEKRFSTRLYVVDKCRVQAASATAEGKLSVAAEVDFASSKVSFWNAPSSDIPNASQIGTCLRGALAGLPIQGIEHNQSRYRLFFTVLFGKAAAKKAATTARADSDSGDKKEATSGAGSSAPPPGKGKLIDVVKDKVRVRKTPVDGEVIGKIAQGNQVRLLKQKDGWCNIVTPSGNEGWMICDALGL